jgi:aspartate aminotransferase-like enzyme
MNTQPQPTRNDILPPQVEYLSTILPDDPLLMMGAGPVPIPSAVARANSLVINHLGDTMAKIISQVKDMARYVFQTRSNWVLGVAGPGSAGPALACSRSAMASSAAGWRK